MRVVTPIARPWRLVRASDFRVAGSTGSWGACLTEFNIHSAKPSTTRPYKEPHRRPTTPLFESVRDRLRAFTVESISVGAKVTAG